VVSADDLVRDFHNVANFLIPNSGKAHLFILIATILMIPGLSASLSPIDIEAYNMDSPELEANDAMREDFAGAGNIWGFGVFIRSEDQVELNPSEIEMISPFPGEKIGVEEPIGGILNLSVLREIDQKAELLRNHDLSQYYLNFASEISGEPLVGVLDLPNELRIFMDNRSLLTNPRISPTTLQWEDAPTNWNDCGELECLSFDDSNITQSHIDLAAHRMANNSRGSFLRFLSVDRSFVADPTSSVIGPLDGNLNLDGTISAENWGNGRWSASSAWMILNLDREQMQSNGWTFAWIDARSEFGFNVDGLAFETDPIQYTMEQCRLDVEEGLEPCSVEWLYLAIEEELRNSDELVVTVLLGEGPNVEINRELLSSAFLIGIMGIVVIALLWLSLRRISDVAIVGSGLIISLVWMQGLIGWLALLGEKLDFELIARSQFSNLLPILVLALGIDDSLHALHRYKEERRSGMVPEQAAHISISRVGRAIMLTSMTTIVAFLANLSSDIAALRSFGVEAGLGVFSAFVLTGLWVPLLRLDLDLFLQSREKLGDEEEGTVHLVPSSWLSATAEASFKAAVPVILITSILTWLSISPMLSLEGDFQIDDFLDDESDFAMGVGLVNERFADGEPGYIFVEGDMSNPLVLDAIGELRTNMNSHGPDAPDQISRTPNGNVELIALDQIILFTQAAIAWNSTPFEEAGWNVTKEDGGVGCQTLTVPHPSNGFVRLPQIDDRGCLLFLYGFILTFGVPESGGYPELPPGIIAEFIQTMDQIDPSQPWLTIDGREPMYTRMAMRFGLTNPEQFALIEPALEQLESDMVPFQNLSSTPLELRGDLGQAFLNPDLPVTWAIPTGDPVVRFVAADGMQDQMQETLAIGLLSVLVTLWWGFRPDGELKERISVRPKVMDLIITTVITLCFSWACSIVIGKSAFLPAVVASVTMSMIWGLPSFGFALLATAPIAVVIVWLYALIGIAGFGLNMVTVSIAAISLGVGVDYVIHVIERFREEVESGSLALVSVGAVGGSSGLALVGSAISDIAGFLVIMQSKMGFFSTFGLFCAVMIGLALMASMILTPAALGLIHRESNTLD